MKGEPPVVRVVDTDGTEKYEGDGTDVRIQPVGPAALLLIPARKRGERVRGELQRLELAPLAANLLSTLQDSGRHQRLLSELLAALDKVLADD